MDKSRPVKVKTMIRLNRFEDIFIKSIVYFLQFFEDSSLKADQKCVEDYIFERIDSDGKLMDAMMIFFISASIFGKSSLVSGVSNSIS